MEKNMDAAKRIALIAHDQMKASLVEWCKKNYEVLSHHFLCGTGTTAKMIAEQSGLPVKSYLSGPLGGDQQIGSMVAEGKLDLIIFLRDPLTSQPHEPDVSALLRLCDVQDIPLATNYKSAEIMLNCLKDGHL